MKTISEHNQSPKEPASSRDAGQAWHVLRGFRYQLLQALNAWLGLQVGETLWLEADEDFSIESKSLLIAAQVKSSIAARGPTSYSLGSDGVRAALGRHWERSRQAAETGTHLVFIANGDVAHERDFSFPNGSAGLDYWAKAAIDADTATLRTALSSIFEGKPLGAWLATNPGDEELRARLLRRVRWEMRALDHDPLSELIHDRIADLFLEKGFLVSLADEALRGLFDRVYETACERSQDVRRLTPRDLHRSIENIASPTAALQAAARSFAGVSTAGDAVFVSSVESGGANTIDRPTTVEQILNEARGEPILWLHGTHGVGKSTLARLVVDQFPGQWLALDLRAFQDDARGALSAWRELMRAISRKSQLQGVLIDDLTGAAQDALQRKLAGFVSSVAPNGTRVLVTSHSVPSSARLAELGASPRAAVQAPYFSETEVRAMINLRDAPPPQTVGAWSQLLLASTYGGHPLLVSAKIANLRARTWPTSALVEDIGPNTSDAVRATREEARRRLVTEIPSPEARRLLGRLGCIFDRADDALVIKLAHVAPPIPNAGDALAILRGSWIEPLPGGDIRLSPLIADIGNDVLAEEVMACRGTAAVHWLGDGALNQRTLPLCFWNAFSGRVTSVLVHLSHAIMQLPSEYLQGAAALLSPMTMLTTKNSIYPEEPTVATMLRLLQFEVCNAVIDNEVAGRAAARLIIEIDAVSHAELKALQMSLAAPKLLLAQNVNLDPTIQLNLILRLRSALKDVATIETDSAGIGHRAFSTEFVSGGDLPGFLFSSVVMRIRSSDRMLRMVEALDGISAEDRSSLIDSGAALMGSRAGSFVHTGWAQEQLDGKDLGLALERFERMETIATGWGRADMLVQLACARSVILDEGLGDRVKALAVIDDAIDGLGDIALLVRQKAKVLGHAGDYAAATSLLESIEDTVATDDLFDRALALRDGAVWASHAQKLPVALRLFTKAFDALVGEGEHPALAAGIEIEIALILWAMTDRPAAVGRLADAFEAIEHLDPGSSRQNERAHQYGRAAAGLFWNRLAPYAAKSTHEIATGQASALSGDEPLLGTELRPLADNWRILALCELEIGADEGIERHSAARLPSGGGLAFIEMFIAMARYCRAISAGDIPASFRKGLIAVAASRISHEALANEATEIRVVDADLQAKCQQILTDPVSLEIVRTIALDVLVWHRLRGGWSSTFTDDVERAVTEAWGDSELIRDVLRAASGDLVEQIPSAEVALAARLASDADMRGDPQARFDRDLLLVSHAGSSLCRRVLEPVIVDEILRGWSAVLANEGFALRSPSLHRPAIAHAIDEARSTGLKGAARLILAAAPAVGRAVSDGWKQHLLRMIGEEGANVGT